LNSGSLSRFVPGYKTLTLKTFIKSKFGQICDDDWTGWNAFGCRLDTWNVMEFWGMFHCDLEVLGTQEIQDLGMNRTRQEAGLFRMQTNQIWVFLLSELIKTRRLLTTKMVNAVKFIYLSRKILRLMRTFIPRSFITIPCNSDIPYFWH
jgi:hypothetical protein